MNNRMFQRGRDWTKLVAGLLPLQVWEQLQTARGDANGNNPVDSLTYIIEQTYDRSVPSHPLLDLLTFDTSPPVGCVATRYKEGEMRAAFKPMGAIGADFNTADLRTQPITVPVENYFSGYEVWLQEANAAALADTNAIPRKAMAVSMAYRDLLVLHTLTGDLDSGIQGILNTDKIKNRRLYSDTDRIGSATSAADMLSLLTLFCHSIGDTSEDIFGDEGGYTLAIPSKLWRRTKRTHFDNSDQTVLQRLESDTGFTVVPVGRLNAIDGALLGSSAGNTACAFAARLSPESHAKMLPQPFTQLPAHLDHAGLRSVVPTVCSLGGLHLYEPLAFAVAENIYDAS